MHGDDFATGGFLWLGRIGVLAEYPWKRVPLLCFTLLGIDPHIKALSSFSNDYHWAKIGEKQARGWIPVRMSRTND